MMDLADRYDALGREEEALKLREESLPVALRVMGVRDSRLSSAVNALAQAYKATDRKQHALTLCENVLAQCRKSLEPGHPLTVRALNKLAIAYAAVGRAPEADPLIAEVRALRKAKLAAKYEAQTTVGDVPIETVSLVEFINADLDEDWHNFDDHGNNLTSLPRGLQTLGGVTFDVRGIVQLSGTNLAVIQPEYPKQVTGIRVGRKAAGLHFLHGTGWPLQDDNDAEVVKEIARYVIHYADGQKAEVPVCYVEQVRNWQFWPEGEAQEQGGAQPVWKGPQERWKPGWPNWGVRLYKTTWQNPRPEIEIASIDFVSAMTGSAPFLIAITGEPPTHERVPSNR